MAQSGVVIAEIARSAGVLPSTVDRMLRDLRAAGDVPRGVHGRGQAVGQFEKRHLANVLLAFGGTQPSDAAASVTILRSLVDAEGRTFGDRVEEWLQIVANVFGGDNSSSFAELPDLITMNVQLPVARAEWPKRDNGSSAKNSIFALLKLPLIDTEEPASVTRSTTIYGPLLLCAGNLLFDYLSRQPQLFKAEKPLKPKNENAGPARPASTRSNQDRKTIRSTEADVKIERGLSQASPRGPGLSTKTSWRPNRAKSDRAPASRV